MLEGFLKEALALVERMPDLGTGHFFAPRLLMSVDGLPCLGDGVSRCARIRNNGPLARWRWQVDDPNSLCALLHWGFAARTFRRRTWLAASGRWVGAAASAPWRTRVARGHAWKGHLIYIM